MPNHDFSLTATPVEPKMALVNPTKFPVSPMGMGIQLDMNPGELDGRFACIQVLPSSIAKAAHKNRKHFLELWPLDRAKALYKLAKARGDFFKAWKEMTGSARPKTEALIIEAKQRNQLRTHLEQAGVLLSDGEFDVATTKQLREWLKNPMTYRADTVKIPIDALVDDDEDFAEQLAEELSPDEPEPEVSVDQLDRKTLWSMAKEMEIPDVPKNINTEILRDRVKSALEED